MEFAEFYSNTIDVSEWAGVILFCVYAALSLAHYLYIYSKGSDIPDINEIPLPPVTLKSVWYYLNPFKFKHPVNYVLTAFSLFFVPTMIAVMWPIAIPLVLVTYLVITARKRNLDKKKMWEELKS